MRTVEVCSNENSEHGHHHHHDKHCALERAILVRVTYVGKSTWVERVLGETPLYLLKENAMRFFELELAQHEKYVLQHGGADMADDAEVDLFEEDEVTFNLTLKHEPNKG